MGISQKMLCLKRCEFLNKYCHWKVLNFSMKCCHYEFLNKFNSINKFLWEFLNKCCVSRLGKRLPWRFGSPRWEARAGLPTLPGLYNFFSLVFLATFFKKNSIMNRVINDNKTVNNDQIKVPTMLKNCLTLPPKSLPSSFPRDPRGFAMKFYTEEGVWDLVGNNTPIFFIRDALLFPSFIHTQKRNPVTHLKVTRYFLMEI